VLVSKIFFCFNTLVNFDLNAVVASCPQNTTMQTCG
jgi:hypothetical protein